MTIASEIQTLQTNLNNSYSAVSAKGGTLPSTQSFNNLAIAINSIPSGSSTNGWKELPSYFVDANGAVTRQSQNPTVTLKGEEFSSIVTIPSQGLYGQFRDWSNLTSTSLDFSSLTTVGYEGMLRTFSGCRHLAGPLNMSSLTSVSSEGLQEAFSSTGITTADFSGLVSVSENNCFNEVFNKCYSLTSVDFSSLTAINGESAFIRAFYDCSSLVNINFSSLASANGNYVFQYAFFNTRLQNVTFPTLSAIKGQNTFTYAFYACAYLQSVSFPALTRDFYRYSGVFYNMLVGVSGCTVHFPSNLQSVIGSWSDVQNGFGGTNTTVLFDLPATE